MTKSAGRQRCGPYSWYEGKRVLKKSRVSKGAWVGLIPICYLALALIVVMLVALSGVYPSGADTMYHIHRSDLVYRAVSRGNWWPAYDPSWYNGVELLRYWPPITPYFMALCQWLGGGDPFFGYLLFVGMACFLGALPWLYIGQKLGRPALGAFLGALWFFVPNNLYALFVEGNLPRAFSMIFLPLYLYNVMGYLWKGRWPHLVGVALSFTLMALCHVGYAGMLALAAILYLLLYGMLNQGSWRRAGRVLAFTLLGFGLMGGWLVPSLVGGISNVDSSEAMATFFRSLAVTLNPLARLEEMNYYIGLSAFLLAVTGTFLSTRDAAPGFLCGVLICLATSTAVYPILSRLPGGQYLWMLRFVSIALCMVLLSLMGWKSLRRPLVLLFCLLFVLDAVPSRSLLLGAGTGITPGERFDAIREYSLLDRAQAVTTQRLALMNEGAVGAIDPYLVSDWGTPTPQTFGAGWEAANTASNIVMLNRSVNEGAYLYLFDRALELGNDTVLVRMAVVKNLRAAPLEQMDAAAGAVGYELVDANEGFRLYHLKDAPRHWGTVSTYRAIGIGSHMGLALSFPGVEEAESNNLSDYTFEELSKYDMVYISDFVYNDKAYAEELVLRLSESGTRVVIVADGIPEDRSARSQTFLGMLCNAITFSNGYPEMDTIDGLINADLFPNGHTTWQSVYMEGLDESWGYLYDAGLKLDFYGTVKNDDLVFIALNLPYFYELTHDASVGELLSHAMRMPQNVLPERRIVPLELEIDGNDITVTSPEDGVNITLAFHDSFVHDGPIYSKNHLTYVDAGTTHIRLAYPYLPQGIALSALSILFTILMARHGYRAERWEKEQKRKEEEEADGTCGSES